MHLYILWTISFDVNADKTEQDKIFKYLSYYLMTLIFIYMCITKLMAGKHYFHRNSFDPVPKYDFCMLIPEVHITHFAQSCPVCVL